MSKLPASAIPSDRLQLISSELRSHAPQWADRLAQVKTEQDLRDFACRLFNLSHWIPSEKRAPFKAEPLSTRIKLHISSNLHRGITLKVLANFFGYSEKYCSDLFQNLMGESFSSYIKRCRVERASSLLATTDKKLADIATTVGFSDQVAFSHFFKRATGHSPMEFRIRQSGRLQRQPLTIPPK